jgi:cation:H+ antiporter
MLLIVNFLLYIVAFVWIWLGSGLIISAAGKFSRKLRLSAFAFSFVFLGMLTSAPEFSVGLQAVADHDPQIFVGNLLGGIIVLFLVVIPLLAVFGNGISLKHELDKKTLIYTLLVILAPAFFILDKKITMPEGLFMILLYCVLLFLVERKNGIFDSDNSRLLDIKEYSYRDILKILLGIGIVFASSSVIVDKTVYFAGFFHLPVFYISLIIVAIGTDLPELSLALRSVISGKKDIAMGDYIGAASVSTLLFGIFTLLHEGDIVTESNFLITFVFIALALLLFYIFFNTRMYISRKNGFILLGLYVLFLFFELII